MEMPPPVCRAEGLAQAGQLGELSAQGSFVLPFREGQTEERIDRLNDLLCPAGGKEDLTAATANPCLEPAEFDSGPFFLKFLSNALPVNLAATFRAL